MPTGVVIHITTMLGKHLGLSSRKEVRGSAGGVRETHGGDVIFDFVAVSRVISDGDLSTRCEIWVNVLIIGVSYSLRLHKNI
jgi:hypothetical protein